MDLRIKLKIRSTPIRPNALLEEILPRYNKESLEGMAKIIQIPSPRTGLRKEELEKKISTHLRNLKVLEGRIKILESRERHALQDLISREGCMPWDEFAKEYGDDLEDSIYWNIYPPKTLMGRLKANGLITEGSFNDKAWIIIPHELKPLLQTILDRAGNP
jgi:hypothetical protein